MYVVVPLAMVLVLFYHTDRVMTDVTTVDGDGDVHVQVIGKQWSWDFNYLDDGVYDSGQHLRVCTVIGVSPDQEEHC